MTGTPSPSARSAGAPALSPGVRWRSNLFRGPLFFLSTGFFGSLSLLASSFDKTGRLQHRIARFWAGVSLVAAGAPLTVIGHENLLPLAIYASNHTSFMDTPVVFRSLPVQFRILAKQSLWKWPFIGWHLDRSGQIPVDEEKTGSAVAGLNRAIRAVRSGIPLFIFPEGGRTPDGNLQPFMNGPAFIAIRARVPLIPMALIGTYDLLPIHARHFHPRPVTVIIGRPIDASAYTVRQVGDLTARLRMEISRLLSSEPELPAGEPLAGKHYEVPAEMRAEASNEAQRDVLPGTVYPGS